MANTKSPVKKKAKRTTAIAAAIEEVVTSDLTERQKLFCVLYTTDATCFGNASRAYIVAYDLRLEKEKKQARFRGHRLVTNEHIKAHIRGLLDAAFTDAGADSVLAELLLQRKDLHARLGAYKEYNKLKKRVDTEEKVAPVIVNILPQLQRAYGRGGA